MPQGEGHIERFPVSFSVSLFLKLITPSHSILGEAPWHCMFTRKEGWGGIQQLSIHAIKFQVD